MLWGRGRRPERRSGAGEGPSGLLGVTFSSTKVLPVRGAGGARRRVHGDRSISGTYFSAGTGRSQGLCPRRSVHKSTHDVTAPRQSTSHSSGKSRWCIRSFVHSFTAMRPGCRDKSPRSWALRGGDSSGFEDTGSLEWVELQPGLCCHELPFLRGLLSFRSLTAGRGEKGHVDGAHFTVRRPRLGEGARPARGRAGARTRQPASPP